MPADHRVAFRSEVFRGQGFSRALAQLLLQLEHPLRQILPPIIRFHQLGPGQTIIPLGGVGVRCRQVRLGLDVVLGDFFQFRVHLLALLIAQRQRLRHVQFVFPEFPSLFEESELLPADHDGNRLAQWDGLDFGVGQAVFDGAPVRADRSEEPVEFRFQDLILQQNHSRSDARFNFV